jgi:alpha-1,3-glucosyltransferase
VPRRHHALQPTPDTWMRTPSPASSRGISPSASIPGGGVSRASAYYSSSFASFSTVMEAGMSMAEQEQGFGRRWLRWMHKSGVKHWVVPCALLASALVRWCVGLGSYSGTSTGTVRQRARTLLYSVCDLVPPL